MTTIKKIKKFLDKMFAVYDQNYREALKNGQATLFLMHTNGFNCY